MVAPTAIINGTPLDCNLCKEDHCKGVSTTPAPAVPPPGGTDQDDDPGHEVDDRGFIVQDDPGFNAWWVKKYCTMTAVDQFILYFPYILLIIALVIVLIERVFVR